MHSKSSWVINLSDQSPLVLNVYDFCECVPLSVYTEFVYYIEVMYCMLTLVGLFHSIFRLEVTLQAVISMEWCMRILSSNTRSCCLLAAREQSPTSLHQEIMTSLWVKITIILTCPDYHHTFIDKHAIEVHVN